MGFGLEITMFLVMRVVNFTRKMVENGIKVKSLLYQTVSHVHGHNATEFNSIIINELT